MIKIDFHIHTVATASDSHFEFDINAVIKYVSEAKLDAIAITNHNVFDLEQYNKIVESVDCTVYPGIEINLEGGHLLVISEDKELDEFSHYCSQVTEKVVNPSISISVDDLKQIYPKLADYILIPHYDKKPSLPDDAIQKLSEYICAGEVNSPKKFMYCIKDESRLVPLYFSDSRMSVNLRSLPVRQTFLSCEDAGFSSIKSCLNDKRKVALSSSESSSLFQIFDNGQMLSTGLNVILGERSSGKSYTLDKIFSEQSVFGKPKYIKQFSLVERDEGKDEQKFDELLRRNHSLLSRDYLDPLKNVVDDVMNIDLDLDQRNVAEYVDSLVKHAKESERHDTFSKAKLFGEEEFPILSQEGLTKLIDSTKNLISNIEFRPIIERNVSLEGLKSLYIELMQEYSRKEEETLKKKWVNQLVGEIKNKLKQRTAATTITDIDFYKIALNISKVRKFRTVVDYAKSERIIENKNLQGFEIVARSIPFNGAGDLKKLSRLKSAFKDAYDVYGDPYQYLQALKKVEGLEEAEYYKYFVKIEYKILNKDGFEVSGGERSEFNLLQEIQDAQKHDILLIDEPESSFDNLFLKQEVNGIIKNIAQSMPVVIVTHNSTVGASIKPDYLLYTRKELENSEIKYRVYSGSPTSKTLLSVDGKSLNTIDITMNCLEAGNIAYNERRETYENLKN